jgi:hypothetical protein
MIEPPRPEALQVGRDARRWFFVAGVVVVTIPGSAWSRASDQFKSHRKHMTCAVHEPPVYTPAQIHPCMPIANPLFRLPF